MRVVSSQLSVGSRVFVVPPFRRNGTATRPNGIFRLKGCTTSELGANRLASISAPDGIRTRINLIDNQAPFPEGLEGLLIRRSRRRVRLQRTTDENRTREHLIHTQAPEPTRDGRHGGGAAEEQRGASSGGAARGEQRVTRICNRRLPSARFIAHLLVCSFARLLVCSFARLLVCSFARLLVCSFARLLVCSFARSAPGTGIEPATFWFRARRNDQQLLPRIKISG